MGDGLMGNQIDCDASLLKEENPQFPGRDLDSLGSEIILLRRIA